METNNLYDIENDQPRFPLFRVVALIEGPQVAEYKDELALALVESAESAINEMLEETGWSKIVRGRLIIEETKSGSLLITAIGILVAQWPNIKMALEVLEAIGKSAEIGRQVMAIAGEVKRRFDAKIARLPHGFISKITTTRIVGDARGRTNILSRRWLSTLLPLVGTQSKVHVYLRDHDQYAGNVVSVDSDLLTLRGDCNGTPQTYMVPLKEIRTVVIDS